LARIAAEAEGVRLRGVVRRAFTRAILGLIALCFVLGALVFAHLAAWYWLRMGLDLTFPAAAGILGGVDLLVAVVLGLLAMRSSPSRVEIEALEVRRKAIQGIASTLSMTQLVIPVVRMVLNLLRRGRG
jgi:hypothetical protein